MGAFIWLLFTTCIGALIGCLVQHPWWGALVGFLCGVAIMSGGGDALGDIADIFDGD